MSLGNLYLLRIVQIDAYIQILQEAINFASYSAKPRKNLIQIQNKYLEERKQIRKFLNLTELWKVKV